MKTEYFVVGAAKSGTTSIYSALKEYKKFSLPIEKEPNTFNDGSSNVPGRGAGDNYATTVLRELGEYDNNYSQPLGAYRVDFSVSYLYDDRAAKNIYEYNPEAKILIVLRNPIKRAFSHYLHMKRDCRENLNFKDALKAEADRIKNGFEFSWHYKAMGLYSSQVEKYISLFGDRVVVIKFEDFFTETDKVNDSIGYFFDLKRGDFELKNDKLNATGIVKNEFLAKIFNRPSALRNLVKQLIPREFGRNAMNKFRNANLHNEKPTLDPTAHDMLREYYKKDINHLSSMLNRDFASWLE